MSKILMTWAAEGGGAGYIMAELSSAMKKAGHGVLHVTPSTIGSRQPAKVLHGLVQQIHRHKPDAIVAAQQQMNIAALLAAKITMSKAKTIIIQQNQLS